MQQKDFLTSSQLIANNPQINASRGPELVVDNQQNQQQGYKSLYPIKLQHGKTQEILITLLSKTNVLTVNKITYGDVIASCSSMCEKLDQECYGIRLIVTGFLSINQQKGQGKIQLEVSGYGAKSVWITIDCNVERIQSQQPAYSSQLDQILPVQVSQIRQNDQNLQYTQTSTIQQSQIQQIPQQQIQQSNIATSMATSQYTKLTGSIVDMINSPDYVPIHETLRKQKLNGSSIIM